jgi:MSHA biogenesis protein MshL
MKSSRALGILIAVAALGAAIVAPAGADESRFDVAVKDAPARAFFEGLADGTPYNIVLEPGVGGNVTLKMKNVTMVEVLDAVRDAYGYDYHRLPSGFIIDPPTLQTRFFQVSYIDLERRGTSRTRIASGQVGQSSSALQSPGTPGGGTDTQSQGLSEPPGSVFAGPGGGKDEHVKEITGTSVSTRSASDFWPALEASLRALIGTEGGRTVVVNAESGLVAVRATPRELRDVQDYLAKIQQIATQQVIIEAKIVEVTLSDAFQAGINWAAIAKSGNSTYSAFQTGPQSGFPAPGLSGNNLNLLTQPSVPVTVGPGNPITSTVSNTLGGAFALAVNTGSFASYVEALSTQGKTTVLSSPQVSTLNNQKAVIKAGDDEYFVTGVQSSVLGVGTVGTQASNLDLAPFFSGVALDVTPQLSESGEIILHIHPTVSNVTPKILNVTANGTANSLPLAYSEVREADSVVKARSGQLVVIGGLMQVTKATQDYRVPGLGDIPLLGNLFRSQQKIKQRSELVILLRPIVVQGDSQWAQVVGDEVDHAAALDPTIRGSVAR